MWELDYKKSYMPKNWCFWTVVLEKSLESPLDCKEIQPVHPKGDQSRIFIGRIDAETETPTLWPPDAKNWLTGKYPDAGKDGRWEEKGTTEDAMVGWHHRLNGHEFEQSPGLGDGQGSLACCSPQGHKELDMTEWLNWTELNKETNWGAVVGKALPQLLEVFIKGMIYLPGDELPLIRSVQAERKWLWHESYAKPSAAGVLQPGCASQLHIELVKYTDHGTPVA